MSKPMKLPNPSELITAQQAARHWKDVLWSRRDEIQAALPRHMSVERLIRITLTSCQRTPKLLACTPASMYSAVLQCAQLGLEPDSVLGLAYLTPRYSKRSKSLEVVLIPGYRGLMQLARRSEMITVLEAHAVGPSDDFDYEYGTKPYLKHRPADLEPEELVFVWALARIRGEPIPQFEVLTRADVEAARARSGSPDEGPWKTDYNAMAKKTVMRQLCKFLPASTELATAVALDERAEAGLPQHLPQPEQPIPEAPEASEDGSGSTNGGPDDSDPEGGDDQA